MMPGMDTTTAYVKPWVTQARKANRYTVRITFAPHALRICGPLAPSAGADIISLLPWPERAPFRLEETSTESTAPGHNGFTLRTASYAPGDSLPPELPGVYWIISLPALMGLKAAGYSRADLYAPDTSSGALRDQDGQILGVQGFVRLN